MCAQLSSHVLEASYAREFLAFLGFDFQKDGAHDKDPFVVFPHWDPDGTLAMTSQVIQAVCGKLHSTYVITSVHFSCFVQVLFKRALRDMEETRNSAR